MEKAVKIGKAIKKKQMNTFSANFKTISVAQGGALPGPVRAQPRPVGAHYGPTRASWALQGLIGTPRGTLGPHIL